MPTPSPAKPETPRGPVPAWTPNALTVLRIALIPAFLFHAHWCIQDLRAGAGDQPHRAIAAAALLGIGISDVIDGWLARRFGLATPLGATLDALADKLAQVSLLVFFATSDGSAFVRVPVWFVALVFGRDLFLAAGTLTVRLGRGRVEVVHQPHGKLVSLLLFALLVWITLDLPRAPVQPVLVTLTVLVVLSTFDYAWSGWRQWRAAAAADCARR
jgi:phosphatidylglycerophosphate synthase